jgi:suppressor of ftsI
MMRRRPLGGRRVMAGALMVLAAGSAATLAAGRLLSTGPFATAAEIPPLKAGQPLREPPVVTAKNGVASLHLTAKATQVSLGAIKAIGNPWNAMLPSPTLEISPGDKMRIKLTNDNPYSEPTNIHVHGMHTSPNKPGDDVFINLPAGHSYQYKYDIPKDQIPGIYWYHPHRHEYTQTQVFTGQAGAIIVKGGLDNVKGVGDVRDRLLVYQATQVNDKGRVIKTPSNSAPKDQLQLINGQLRPTIDIHPGETQRWRILNASSDRFLVLRLKGHFMWLLANDGNPETTPIRTSTQFIGPGERREILVRASSHPGRFALESMHFVPVKKQPSYSGPTRTIATMVVAGPKQTPRRIPDKLLPVEDLRHVHVDRTRLVTFTEGFIPKPPTPFFYINGKEFNPNKILFKMRLGDVEEWTVVNKTDEWHTFHIHINPYQVTKINGKPVKGLLWDDNVAIGPFGGSITFRTRFKDFTGKFVIHCHVLFHEDHGMMAAVEVVPRNAKT